MAIQDTVDLIIDEAITRAAEFSDQAQDAVDQAVQAAQALAVPGDPGSTSPPALADLAPPDPSINYLQIFQDAQDALSEEILSSSTSEYNDFVDKYFPLTLNAIQVAWLEDIILNGGTGLPAEYEDSLWNRSRERIHEEMGRAEEQVVVQFASLGWADPPGALATRLRQIQESASIKACDVNRDVYMDQAKRAHDQIQFAVAEATKLQQTVWQAADSFSQSVTRAIGPAVASGAGQVEAASKFYQETLQYYRTILMGQELVLQEERGSVDINFRNNDQVIKIINDRATRMTEAALGAAKVLGDMSSASLAGQNTMASATIKATSTAE